MSLEIMPWFLVAYVPSWSVANSVTHTFSVIAQEWCALFTSSVRLASEFLGVLHRPDLCSRVTDRLFYLTQTSGWLTLPRQMQAVLRRFICSVFVGRQGDHSSDLYARSCTCFASSKCITPELLRGTCQVTAPSLHCIRHFTIFLWSNLAQQLRLLLEIGMGNR